VTEPKFNPEQNKKNRKVILAIFGIPALVFLLSTITYYLVETRAIDLETVNNGQLITPPLQFAELELFTVNGDEFDYTKPEPKWAYLVIGDRYCSNDCERMLYVARQSITALGKNMHKVRLLYVTTDGVITGSLQQQLQQEYHGVDIISLSRPALEHLFEASSVNPFEERSFFVIDPKGWLMMTYHVDNTEQATLNDLGKSVIRDMKRLIK